MFYQILKKKEKLVSSNKSWLVHDKGFALVM